MIKTKINQCQVGRLKEVNDNIREMKTFQDIHESLTEKKLETHTSITGKTVDVYETGKTFKTVTTYPKTKRTPEEVKTIRHRSWKGVEDHIKKMMKHSPPEHTKVVKY